MPYEGRVIEGEDGYLLVPHGFDLNLRPHVVMKNGKSAPPLPKVGSSPSHFDFAWTTYMTDAILLGGVAERLPGRRHVWDDVSKSFDTREATALLNSAYSEGWDLPQAT